MEGADTDSPASYRQFDRKGKAYTLILADVALTWIKTKLLASATAESAISTTEKCSIGTTVLVKNLLVAKTEHRTCTPEKTAGGPVEAQGSLVLHYVKSLPKHRLRADKMTFQGSIKTCEICAEEVNRRIKKHEYQRPKNILVFINPTSGGGKGLKVYRRKVEPLFTLCDIQTKVIVTKHAEHSKEVLRDCELQDVDGIVCAGGDGTFSEVINSLLHRCFDEGHVKKHSPDTPLPRPYIPFGIIPTGTGNSIVKFVHETTSVKTAALHIILGQRKGLDIASVHEGSKLLSYTCLMVGYGLYGRMIEAIENRRWMGKLRYSVVPMVELMRISTFDSKIEYLPPAEEQAGLLLTVKNDPQSITESSVLSNFEVSRTSTDDTSLNSVGTEWVKLKGRYIGIDSFVVRVTPIGKSMRPYIGNGLAQLTLVRDCPRMQHFSHLVKLMNRTQGFYDYDFLEELHVRGYRVDSTSQNTSRIPEVSLMNCDGDLVRLEHPRFEVRVHQQLIKLFTWVEDDED